MSQHALLSNPLLAGGRRIDDYRLNPFITSHDITIGQWCRLPMYHMVIRPSHVALPLSARDAILSVEFSDFRTKIVGVNIKVNENSHIDDDSIIVPLASLQYIISEYVTVRIHCEHADGALPGALCAPTCKLVYTHHISWDNMHNRICVGTYGDQDTVVAGMCFAGGYVQRTVHKWRPFYTVKWYKTIWAPSKLADPLYHLLPVEIVQIVHAFAGRERLGYVEYRAFTPDRPIRVLDGTLIVLVHETVVFKRGKYQAE